MATKLCYVTLLAIVNLVRSENESDKSVSDLSDLSTILDFGTEGRGIKKYIPLIVSLIHAMVTKFIVVKIFFAVIIIALYYKFFHAFGWLKWWLLKEYKAKKEVVIHHDHDHDWHDHNHDHGWDYGQNIHYRQDNKANGPYKYKSEAKYSTLPEASNIQRFRRSATRLSNHEITLKSLLDDFERKMK